MTSKSSFKFPMGQWVQIWQILPGAEQQSDQPNLNVIQYLTSNQCFDNFNSLAPGKFELNFRYVIFKRILVIDGWGIACEIAQIWMSPDFTDDKSTLVQVMAWCRQATSHYLSQCWPRSLSPYGVTRPQWVKMQKNLRMVKIYCGKWKGSHWLLCSHWVHLRMSSQPQLQPVTTL